MQLKFVFLFLIGVLLATDSFAEPFDGSKDAQKSQFCVAKLAYISQRTFINRVTEFSSTAKKIPLKMKVITHFQKPGFTEFESNSIVEVRNTIFETHQWLNAYKVNGEVISIDINYSNKEAFDSTARMIMVAKKNDIYSLQLVNEITNEYRNPSVLMTTKDEIDFVQFPRLKTIHQNIILFGSTALENYFLMDLKSGHVQNISLEKLKNGQTGEFNKIKFYVGHFDTDAYYSLQMSENLHRSPLTFKIPKN